MFFNQCIPIIKLAIPLIFANLVNSSLFILYTLWNAQINPENLAACALALWLYLTFFMFLFGILNALNILICYYDGANDQSSISSVFQAGFILAIIFSLISFLIFWNISPLLLLTGQNPHIVQLCEGFFHGIIWGFLPTFLNVIFIEIFIGLRYTHIVLAAITVDISLKLFFGYMLILGKFNFPQLGVAGGGWGIAIASWISFAIFFTYFIAEKTFSQHFKLLFSKPKLSYLLELIRIGLPIGLMLFVEFGFFFVFTLLMGHFNIHAIGANQIVLQYVTTLDGIVFVISLATIIEMGYFLGGNDFSTAKKTAYAGAMISIIFTSVIILLYSQFPHQFINIFFGRQNHANYQVIQYLNQFLPLGFAFLFFETIRTCFHGALRALKDTAFILLTAILCFWVIALPLGYFLSMKMDLGANGLWWGLIIGAALTIPILYWRLKVDFKKLKNSSTQLVKN